MFDWYRQAEVCYAYLSDISSIEELSTSRWFTRGWTLQELIAPRDVQFYSSDWTLIGGKSDDVLSRTINGITGIESSVLLTGEFESICAARRMAWAASRETTRIEDLAYSLFGIFGVNMPLIYGEGKNASLRLQQQVMLDSDDLSILAWGMPQLLRDAEVVGHGDIQHISRGPFANYPSQFATPHVILQAAGTNFHDPTPPTVIGSAVTIRAAITRRHQGTFLVLPCTTISYPDFLLAIPVVNWEGKHYERCGNIVRISMPENKAAESIEAVSYRQRKHANRAAEPVTQFRFCRTPNPFRSTAIAMKDVYCPSRVVYDKKASSFSYAIGHVGVVGAILFAPTPDFLATQTNANVAVPDRMFHFAIILELFASSPDDPYFTIVEIVGEHDPIGVSPGLHGINLRDLEAYVAGDLDRARSFDYARFREICLSRAVHTLPASGFWVKSRDVSKKRDKEELQVLLGVHVITSAADYVNKAHFLCIDVAGQMSYPNREELPGWGGVNRDFMNDMVNLDWQVVKAQGGFQPSLADLEAQISAVQVSGTASPPRHVCGKQWCLVCSYGPQRSSTGFF
jgi:hypothetical protein